MCKNILDEAEVIDTLTKTIGVDEFIDQIGHPWAVRINEMLAGGADPPYTLNNVKLIALDLRYMNHKSYFTCLAGVLDVVITIPGHIGFMIEGFDYENSNSRSDSPFPDLNCIKPEYYIQESLDMINYGLRSNNGKIVKDYNRFGILIEAELIDPTFAKGQLETLGEFVVACEEHFQVGDYTWGVSKLRKKYEDIKVMVTHLVAMRGGGIDNKHLQDGGSVSCLCMDYTEMYWETDEIQFKMELEELNNDLLIYYNELIQDSFVDPFSHENLLTELLTKFKDNIPDGKLKQLLTNKGELNEDIYYILEESEIEILRSIWTKFILIKFPLKENIAEIAIDYSDPFKSIEELVESIVADMRGGGSNNRLNSQSITKIQKGGDASCLNFIPPIACGLENLLELYTKTPDTDRSEYINSGSLGSTITKKLNVYEFFSVCGINIDGLGAWYGRWFRPNPKLVKGWESTVEEGMNFETLQKIEKTGKDVPLFNDYITCPLRVIYQDNNDTDETVGIKLRQILVATSEKACFIKLLQYLNACLINYPENIGHLAQFKYFKNEGEGEERWTLYANYILINLINSFNPHKLMKQKRIFSDKLEANTYNKWLLLYISEFYRIVEIIAEGKGEFDKKEILKKLLDNKSDSVIDDAYDFDEKVWWTPEAIMVWEKTDNIINRPNRMPILEKIILNKIILNKNIP